MDELLDIGPVEVILHCLVCNDPCARMQLGNRAYVHYDELVDLDGASNYDHPCEVPLYYSGIIDVKIPDPLDT